MGINTLTPRYLNLDNDSRIIAAQEMVDALNVRVSADDGGDQGVVKNIAGNSVVGNNLGYSFIGSNNTIVGCYEHEATNRFFVFVHSSVGYHTVYELNQSDSSFTKIIESANITLTTTDLLSIDGMMIDEELHLYYTNGVDEPQKLNVDTSIAVGIYPSSVNEAFVMKRAPNAPVVNISTDTSKSTNELYGKAFQFALQYVYRDGEVSAIGEYSDEIAGLNTLESLSDSVSYKNQDNKITIQIGTGTLGMGLGSTIPNLRVFYKKPEDNTMYYVGEFTYAELFNGLDFYNDKSYPVVSDAEYNKTTDNVPKSAKAQAITANRLFYGNYTEGFDKGTVSASLTAVYADESANSELDVTVTASGTGQDSIEMFINTENVDALIDGTSIPTTIDFTFGYLEIRESTGRAITFYESDGTTVKKSFTAADSNNDNRFRFNDEKYVTSTSVPATTYADYNTNLASALNGNTFSFDVATGGGSAEYDNSGAGAFSYDTWKATFDSGNVNFSITATAASNGVTLNIVPTTFSVSGTQAWLTDVVGFSLPTVVKPYVTSLSGTFGSTAADRYMIVIRGDNFSTVGSGSSSNRTFKSGESHSLGVVFEDQLGRTSGVYELGSVDIERKSERANKGAASIESVITASGLDSDFTSFFYVYSGGNGIADYVQYSVPQAFVLDATKVEETAGENIYISLRALQGANNSYCEDNDIDYKFTKGDKLRIISYTENDIPEYPSNYEFDVLGLETIESDSFVIHSGGSYDKKIHDGQFIVVKNNSIAQGFTYADVVAQSTAGNATKWEDEVFVEIYTPSKETETKIYYAISGKYDVGTDIGQTQSLTEGNAWYKKRALKFAVSNTSDDFTEEIYTVESKQYFDEDSLTKGQLGGKPYAVLANEKEYSRLSSVTYSEPQFADSAQNYLSSFNASLANFKDFELNYGGIFGLCDLSDSIMVLQSDKVSRVPVSRNILTTAGGQDFVTQTTEVLGLQQSYDGNFGINEDRQAFLKVGGDVYLVDVTRSKIVSLGSQGIKVLSDMNISSWLEERCDTMLGASSYSVSIGNDKKNSEVIFTLQDSDNNYIKSIVYSSGLGKFTSFVDYSSDFYGNLGNRFLQIRDNDVYEAEKNPIYGHFFGLQYDAYVKAVFNQNPASRKVFNAIGVDGTANPSATLSTIDQSVSMPEGAFSLREGVYYGNVPREEGTSQFVMLGAVRSENDPEITFEAKVNRLPFRLGGEVFKLSGGVMTAIAGVTADSIVSSRVVSMSNGGAVTAGDVIGVKGASVDGDPLRGAYAEVQLDFNDATAFELFSITAHTSESGLHNNPQTQQ